MKYYDSRMPDSIKTGWYEHIFMKFRENRDEWIASGFDVQPINAEKFPSYKQRLKPLGHHLPAFLKDLEREIKKECGNTV